jgi:hypothetical protein
VHCIFVVDGGENDALAWSEEQPFPVPGTILAHLGRFYVVQPMPLFATLSAIEPTGIFRVTGDMP